jgi:hypothetical protein
LVAQKSAIGTAQKDIESVSKELEKLKARLDRLPPGNESARAREAKKYYPPIKSVLDKLQGEVRRTGNDEQAVKTVQYLEENLLPPKQDQDQRGEGHGGG